jgi:glycerol-3-phosphate dehydrogenase
MNGATFFPYREVVEFSKKDGRRIDGVRTYNTIKKETEDFQSDLIINAAGPWAGRVAQIAGVTVESMAFAGAMGVAPSRLCSKETRRQPTKQDQEHQAPRCKAEHRRGRNL